MVVKDPMGAVRTKDGVAVTNYVGLTPRQKENLEGLWKNKEGYCEKDWDNIPAAIQLQTLYRRANEYYSRFLRELSYSEQLGVLCVALRYFFEKVNRDFIGEEEQKRYSFKTFSRAVSLCEDINKEHAFPLTEYSNIFYEMKEVAKEKKT